MIKFITKRNGENKEFITDKIISAMEKAFVATCKSGYEKDLEAATRIVMDKLFAYRGDTIGIEDVQDIAVDALLDVNRKVGLAYATYREAHSKDREFKKSFMDSVASIYVATDRSNANVTNGPMAKMLQAGGVATKSYNLEYVIPKEFSKEHREGGIHIHDLDFYGFTVNCSQIPVKKLFETGFNTGHGFTRPPKRIGTAVALACILIQASQNDFYGGQSIPAIDSVMARFCGPEVPDEEISQAAQALVYNLNTMHSRAGSQIPFSSLNFGLDMSEGARRWTKALLTEYEKGLGNGENPIFPNLLFQVKDGVSRRPGDPNYDLFKLAMRVTSRRMNPTYIFMDAEVNKPYKSVEYMGCRTRVIGNVNGPETSEGRGNLFFVTMNLPRLGILARKAAQYDESARIEKFFELLDKEIDLCERHLMDRYKYVCDHIKVKDMPFVMGQHLYMGSEGLKPEDSIEPAIRNGTLSMGFIGLAETLVALTGKHHGESEEAEKLGLRIVSHMHDAMEKMTEKTHLNFSLFATPAEGLAGRFTAIDRKRFGVIKGVTDREYYTNSVHVPVYCPISHFKKMEIEGKYHKFCTAGHIAYVEFDAPPANNLRAVEAILNHMADSNIGYAGINFPIDFCDSCGYQGVIPDDVCPVCGKSGHIHRIRRVTGYFSEIQNMNDGKLAEVHDRTSTHTF